jgi:hypothetical protein
VNGSFQLNQTVRKIFGCHFHFFFFFFFSVLFFFRPSKAVAVVGKGERVQKRNPEKKESGLLHKKMSDFHFDRFHLKKTPFYRYRTHNCEKGNDLKGNAKLQEKPSKNLPFSFLCCHWLVFFFFYLHVSLGSSHHYFFFFPMQPLLLSIPQLPTAASPFATLF